MRKKILFCATVDYHFRAFHLPYLKWFKEQGWEVHVAAAGELELPYVDQKYHIPVQRSPIKQENIGAYRALKTIIDDNQYDLIHCHTPMGGVLARLAARKARKQNTKVIYTAHGFHFCKGAPLVSWLIYYPIEKLLARHTDCLITINSEDYQLAVKQLKAGKIEHVHGVGVDTERFAPVSANDRSTLRQKYHYHDDAFLLFYAAEFNKNKNQQILVKALAHVKDQLPHVRLLLAGEGPLLTACKQIAQELGVEEMVDFLGYRNDIESLLKICDIAVASSLREGLPVNIMEAMACGLPVIAVDNRGHRELVRDNQNGWLVGTDSQEIAERLLELAINYEKYEQFAIQSRAIIENNYSLIRILEEKSKLYQNVMKEMEETQWMVH